MENATAIAEWVKTSGRGIGPQAIDLAIGNIPNTPAGAHRLHWKRRLQDNEKRELERREAERKDLEEIRKTRKEQASVEVHSELRLSERAKAHRDMMNRPTEKTVVGSADNTDWKSRAESVHLDVRSWNEQSWIQKMFVMNPTKPTEIDWQATYQARRRECDVYKNRGGK